jgi:TnpA family transposase
LAYLLGIKLMPRIKNWKHLTFYRPQKNARYQHIEALFSDHIDWRLITENFDEMLKTAVSIKAGNLMPSTVSAETRLIQSSESPPSRIPRAWATDSMNTS